MYEGVGVASIVCRNGVGVVSILCMDSVGVHGFHYVYRECRCLILVL